MLKHLNKEERVSCNIYLYCSFIEYELGSLIEHDTQLLVVSEKRLLTILEEKTE